MRVNIFSDEGLVQRKRIAKGSTLTGFLTLISEPLVPDDAVTKTYVDGLFSNLTTDKITVGTISESQLPGMLGDAISSPGSSVVNLRPITSAGTVVAPTVDAKGRVTSGGTINASDLPDLDWSVVSTGAPTDVIGYGITDAVGANGGAVNVNISLYANPTEGTHAATKDYVDTAVLSGGGAGVSVGDIVLKYTDTTPTGYLKCNGALASKTTYANLYDYLKTDYDLQTIAGAGKPWSQQHLINLNNTLDFSASSAGGILAATSAFGQVAVTKNKVFLLGGSNGYNLSNIQTATVSANGSLSAWSNASLSLPSTMKHFQVLTTKNRLYLLGGVGTGNANNSVLYSTIDASGNLSSWQTDGILPHGVSGHRAFITSSRMYVLGGSVDGNSTGIVNTYYAPINADGSLGSWVAGPDLPTPNQFFSIAVTKNKLYVIGGHTGTVTVSAVSVADIDTNGVLGAFTSNSFLPQARAMGQTLVTDKFIYFLGGCQNNNLTGVTTEIMRAPIDNTGAIGSWSVVTGSCPVRGGEILSLTNNIYVLGGVDNSNNYVNSTISYTTTNSGGLNDYSDYYNNPLFSSQGADLFSLPELNSVETPMAYYYIKY